MSAAQHIFMQSSYTLYYYISPSGDNPISDFLNSLSEIQQAKVLRIFQYLKEYGLSSILPHTKKLTGTPMWEIRILGKDNIRMFYVIPMQRVVLIVHGFIKKSQKTPVKEIRIAITRFEQWKHLHGALDK